MIWKVLIAAAIAAACQVAASAQETIAGHTVYRDARPDIWQGHATDGPLTHKATGAVFPDKIGPFKRSAVAAVDDGDDVMAQFSNKLDGRQATISVYLFKPGELPEHTLKGSVAAIGAASAANAGPIGTFLWSDGPFLIDAGQKLRAYKATYKTGIGPGTYLDYLYFVPIRQWTVKVRATLEGPKDVAEENAVNDLVRALPWQAILAANGACTGKACTTDGAFAMNSHINESRLSSLIDMLDKQPAAQRAKAGGGTVLFDGERGGAQWRVGSLSGIFGRLFTDAFGNVDAVEPLLSLSRTDGKGRKIVRFYSGAPTKAEIAAEIDGLIAHPERSEFLTPQETLPYLPAW